MKKTIIRAHRSRNRRAQTKPVVRDDVSSVDEVSSSDEIDEERPTRQVSKSYAAQRLRDKLDPFDQFKCFPVNIDIVKEENHFVKRIISINRKVDIVVADVDMLRGITTGVCSNLTIIDVHRDSKFYEIIESLIDDTLCVYTPNGGMHLYYHYNDRLNSIYDTLDGVSVLNDNRFVFAGGGTYQVRNKFVPVAIMPQVVFDPLYEAQCDQTKFHKGATEVFAVLDEDWFLESSHLKDLIFAMRNERATPKKCMNTIKHALVERFGWYDRYKIKEMINEPMTDRQRRYTLKKLIKHVQSDIGIEEYEKRMRHFKESIRKDPYPLLRHEPDTITKLQDIKAIYPDLTAKKLLNINGAFTSRQIHMCRLCNERHHKNCCNDSTATHRVKRTIIDNISIIN